jgi:hypothetical protein
VSHSILAHFETKAFFVELPNFNVTLSLESYEHLLQKREVERGFNLNAKIIILSLQFSKNFAKSYIKIVQKRHE